MSQLGQELGNERNIEPWSIDGSDRFRLMSSHVINAQYLIPTRIALVP